MFAPCFLPWPPLDFPARSCFSLPALLAPLFPGFWKPSSFLSWIIPAVLQPAMVLGCSSFQQGTAGILVRFRCSGYLNLSLPLSLCSLHPTGPSFCAGEMSPVLSVSHHSVTLWAAVSSPWHRELWGDSPVFPVFLPRVNSPLQCQTQEKFPGAAPTPYARDLAL